jgi:hypothetical protein
MAHDPDVLALIQRAQRVRVDMAILCDELAITRAESQRLLLLARQGESPARGDAATQPIVEEPPAQEDLHVLAMEVLRMMGELLNGFRVEWQVSIIKVITARTMLVVGTQLKKQPIALTA